jgi:hypothetical protein
VAALYSYPLKLNYNANGYSTILNKPPLDSTHPNLASLFALQIPPSFTAVALPPFSAVLQAPIHSPTLIPPLKMDRIVSLRFYLPIYPYFIAHFKLETE